MKRHFNIIIILFIVIGINSGFSKEIFKIRISESPKVKSTDKTTEMVLEYLNIGNKKIELERFNDGFVERCYLVDTDGVIYPDVHLTACAYLAKHGKYGRQRKCFRTEGNFSTISFYKGRRFNSKPNKVYFLFCLLKVASSKEYSVSNLAHFHLDENHKIKSLRDVRWTEMPTETKKTLMNYMKTSFKIICQNIDLNKIAKQLDK